MNIDKHDYSQKNTDKTQKSSHQVRSKPPLHEQDDAMMAKPTLVCSKRTKKKQRTNNKPSYLFSLVCDNSQRTETLFSFATGNTDELSQDKARLLFLAPDILQLHNPSIISHSSINHCQRPIFERIPTSRCIRDPSQTRTTKASTK